MQHWAGAVKRALVSGSVASVASTLALSVLGRAETGSATAPTNATSHWLWGERATRVDGGDVRHTVPGYLIHHASSVFWAAFYERYCTRPAAPLRTLRDAGLTAALACFVDYRLTPRRLTPGFERRLSRPSLAAVYVSFGLGLAVATGLHADRAQAVSPR